MIRLVDRLVLKELVGPWIFGVALFTMLLMAGTYLFRLTDFFVKGVDAATIVQLSILYMPSLVAKTFPMAVLLASLLAFARLSNDSEIIALQAGGASLFRIMWPVALFGVFVSFLSFAFGEVVVPRASLQALQLQSKVQKMLSKTSSQSYSQPLYIDGRLRGALLARDVNVSSGTMYGVLGVWYDDAMNPKDYLYFRELYYTDTGWEVKNGEMFREQNGRIMRLQLEEARPFVEAIKVKPRDILSATLKDADILSMPQLSRQISTLKKNPHQNRVKIRDLEVGYWTKVSLPLSALVFALVGAPVAIRRVRQGVGVGIAVSILVIFAYYLLHNYLNILARGDRMEPVLSAFIPVLVGLVAAVVLLVNKGR